MNIVAAVLGAAIAFVVGARFGAAVQRWGDDVRASGHLGTSTTWTEPDDGVVADPYLSTVLAGRMARFVATDDDGER